MKTRREAHLGSPGATVRAVEHPEGLQLFAECLLWLLAPTVVKNLSLGLLAGFPRLSRL